MNSALGWMRVASYFAAVLGSLACPLAVVDADMNLPDVELPSLNSRISLRTLNFL
jgi:hypothetical protein